MPKITELSDREVAEIAAETRRRLSQHFSERRINKWATYDMEVAERFVRLTWIVIREKLERELDA